MIARVMTFDGEPYEVSEETRAWTQKTMDEACTHDGVEAVVSLTDPATGKALAINFFRDQAALDAFEEFSRQKLADSREHSGSSDGFSDDHVYTDVMAAQSAPSW